MAKSKSASTVVDVDPEDLTEETTVPVDDENEDDEEETAEQAKARLDAAVVTVEMKGQSFSFPKRKGRWRMGVHRDIDNGQFSEALIKLIGEERYQSLDASGWCLDDFSDLSRVVGAAIEEQCVP